MKINVCPGDDRQTFYPSLKQTDRTCWMIHAGGGEGGGGGSPQTNSEELNAMQLFDCGWKLPIRTKISKKILISELLISSPRKKALNKVIKRLSTLRTWMLPLSFNILCERRRNRNRKRKRILVSV